MPTYTLEMNLPYRDVEEFLEKIREVAAVETCVITIEAPDKRSAVNDLAVAIEEFENTYSGNPRWIEVIRTFVQNKLVRVSTAKKVA